MTQLSRRHFLKVSAAGTATAILAGCGGERWVELVPYVVAPEEQLAGVPTYFASTCRMCPAACGILVKTMNGRAIKIEGNPEHPISRGRTCARGQSGLQLLYNPDRITGAVEQEKRGSRRYQPIAWNDGINRLYERLNEAGSRVAIWLGSATSGHLVDLFTLFADAIGAPAPVRYDLYAAYHGYDVLQAVSNDLLGSAALPAYDLAGADVIFSFGADYLGTWLNATAYNVAYGQFRSQRPGQRGYFVQFEPRMTNTGAAADRWVPVRSGDEALVAQALVRLIADKGFGSAQRVEAAQATATDVDVAAVAAACHLTVDQLTELARVFAEAERPVALPGAGLAGRDNATAAVAAVQALNVLAGTIGQAGGLSLAQGIEDASLLPAAASTFADAQALVARMQAGEVDVLLVHGANPVYDMPAALGLVEALAKVGTVVSFSPMPDETAVYADLVLPDRVYLEGWGYDVATPAQGGLPIVSSQQPVVGPLYDARSTADVLLTVARGIGAAAAALPWADEVA
ncbi:MAG: molybdopterin-dependent oxidoreductase, partial [Anaerolineae bacterium]|nr:molybdopterin-dependent oxidoreductase [Anaerolineae bacterium]